MLIFVTGGAASGKSEFAESLAVSCASEKRFYLATMNPEGREAEERIKKHRENRSGRNFITIERQSDIEGFKIPSPPEETLILLEDLGNLVANEQFSTGGSDEEIIRRVRNGIEALCDKAGTVIVVGDDVFSDGKDYPSETPRYMKLLGEISQIVAGLAAEVWDVIFGIALPVKITDLEREDHERKGRLSSAG